MTDVIIAMISNKNVAEQITAIDTVRYITVQVSKRRIDGRKINIFTSIWQLFIKKGVYIMQFYDFQLSHVTKK